MAGILKKPLVCIGADVGEHRSVGVYMHEGYDYPRRENIDWAVKLARKLKRPGFYHVIGDRANPAAWWPVYVNVMVLDG